MFRINEQTGQFEATESVPNFPTRESYTTPYDGCNVRTPHIESDGIGEIEDTDAQDQIMQENRINNFSKYYHSGWFE